MDPNRQTVLIVDDMPENISLLGELLKEEYNVRVAVSGEKALIAARAEPVPDLILLDIVMPGMDGYEVCRRLKADEVTLRIPVIFITSRAESIDEVAGFETGAVDYITKPFNPVVVRARVRTHAELKRHKDWLMNSTYTDALTNLPNRRRFDEHYDLAWKFACRSASQLSLIMIDVDFFKEYNDYYGHQTGDECLREIAGRMSRIIRRSTDILCRYGGEEFVCVLPDTDMVSAEAIAEALRETVLEPAIPHGASPSVRQVTISLGIATIIPDMEIHPQALLIEADRALYQSKKEGRNRVTARMMTELGAFR